MVDFGSWQLGIKALGSFRSHESWEFLVESGGSVRRRLYLSLKGYRAVRSISLLDSSSCFLIPLRLMHLFPSYSILCNVIRLLSNGRRVVVVVLQTLCRMFFPAYLIRLLSSPCGRMFCLFISTTVFPMVLRLCTDFYDFHTLLSHDVHRDGAQRCG